jgi:gas vesicle protein
MRRFISFLSGAVTGALVGAVIAILLAPSSGDSLRTQLRERANLLQADIKQAAAARRAELEEQLETLCSPQARMD